MSAEQRDPRGPLRTVAEVEKTTTETRVRFVECGHVGRKSAYMTVREGERVRCFDCTREKSS